MSGYSGPGLSPRHLLLHVIRPTLAFITGTDAPEGAATAAEELVLGTAAHESKLRALDQITGRADATLGPAFGLWQMERATHDDIWQSYLSYRKPLAARLRDLVCAWPDPVVQLATNLCYGAAMARVHYMRVPAPLPPAGNVAAQAAYWKAHYNTAAGKGTPAQYAEAWRSIVAPHL